MQLKPGTRLKGNEYEILRTIGQGGFGITYEAVQLNLDRKVAIKEFYMKSCCERNTDSFCVSVPTQSNVELVNKFRGKFIREAKLLASFDHPGIVRVFDIFEENGTAYYVMENLPGGALSALVHASGPLSEPDAEHYVRAVADALAYIHARNTMHLDVKPSNILLNQKKEAVLIDFGISKRYDVAGEQTSSTPVGISKGYAPLEQAHEGGVSQFQPSTDIYSLGATLYFLVTGMAPPDASDVNEDGLERPAGVSDRVWNVIEKSMQPRRKDRPQDIAAFLRLFDAFPGVHGVPKGVEKDETVVVSRKPEVKPAKGNRKGLYWIAGCAAALVALALVLLLPRKTASDKADSSFGYLLPSRSLSDSASYAVGLNLYSAVKESVPMRTVITHPDFLVNVERYFKTAGLAEPSQSVDFSDAGRNYSASEYASGAFYYGASYGLYLRPYFKRMPWSYSKMKQGIDDLIRYCTSGDESVLMFGFEEMKQVLDRVLQQMTEYSKAVNRDQQEKYFARLRKRPGVRFTGSGLAYEILKESSGKRATSEQDTVYVNYVEKLIDGTEFDRNDDISFPLTHVIQGLSEGMQLVGEGGKIRLYVPSELGYGERGSGVIEPNSTLIFDVDLLRVGTCRP